MVHKRGGAHKCDESTVRRWTCLLVQECEQQDGERASLFRSSGMWRKRQWTCIFVQMWTRRRWTCLLVQDVSNKTVNVPPCSECEREDDERASLFRMWATRRWTCLLVQNVNKKTMNVPPCSGMWTTRWWTCLLVQEREMHDLQVCVMHIRRPGSRQSQQHEHLKSFHSFAGPYTVCGAWWPAKLKSHAFLSFAGLFTLCGAWWLSCSSHQWCSFAGWWGSGWSKRQDEVYQKQPWLNREKIWQSRCRRWWETNVPLCSWVFVP
jgi:hypothetical protein